jgi:hypothetical protein
MHLWHAIEKHRYTVIPILLTLLARYDVSHIVIIRSMNQRMDSILKRNLPNKEFQCLEINIKMCSLIIFTDSKTYKNVNL